MKLLPLLLIAVVVVTIVAEERSYRPRHKGPPRHRRSRVAVDRKARDLCKESFLSRLNPTESCKKGCLITCGSKSKHSVGRCEVCRDKCCEANCHGFECIPVSQISDIIGTVLDIYQVFGEDRSIDLEETTVAETTVTTKVPAVAKNGN
uniref:Stigma-specific STIG1-like protein 1 n=1 Tax=Panagrellus redivivus TaxID=6233 RepID=A0A7E4ZZZ8_PANRE